MFVVLTFVPHASAMAVAATTEMILVFLCVCFSIVRNAALGGALCADL